MHRLALRSIPTAALVALVAGCGSSGGGTTQPQTTPARPPAQPPKSASGLTGIGSGLRGPKDLAASVWTTGLPGVSDLVTGPGDQLFATVAGTSADGVYLVPRGGAPRPLIRGLAGPQGMAWIGSRLIVSSKGRVAAYTGFDGHRFTGHTNLLHGLPAGNGNVVAGPDGRLYMGIASADKVVSFKPDGSGLRDYASGVRGSATLKFDPMIAVPFALVSSQSGDQLRLIRPREDSAIADFGANGAVDGLALVHSEWGSAYTLSALVSEQAPGRVIRAALTPSGDGFTAKESVLLTGLSNAGPMVVRDGRLLLADQRTGTIYDIAPKTAAPSSGGHSPGAAPAPAPPAQTTPAPAPKKKKPAHKKKPPKAAPQTAAHALSLAADPNALKFSTTTLTTAAGSVKLTLDNPSQIPHNVTVAEGTKKIGATPTFTKGKRSVILKLKPGTYTFYCSVPGHEQAGMKGTLTVK